MPLPPTRSPQAATSSPSGRTSSTGSSPRTCPQLRPRVMGATQRPPTEAALSEGLPTDAPAWRHIPSWSVFGDQDMNIPVALHRFMAERGRRRGQPRAHRRLTRAERLRAQGRHRDDPRGHRHPVTHDTLASASSSRQRPRRPIQNRVPRPEPSPAGQTKPPLTPADPQSFCPRSGRR